MAAGHVLDLLYPYAAKFHRRTCLTMRAMRSLEIPINIVKGEFRSAETLTLPFPLRGLNTPKPAMRKTGSPFPSRRKNSSHHRGVYKA